MSRFYGTIHGAAKTTATRRGHSEIVTHAASWAGAVRVRVWLDPHTNQERFSVNLVPWKGHGVSEVLAEGILGAKATGGA